MLSKVRAGVGGGVDDGRRRRGARNPLVGSAFTRVAKRGRDHGAGGRSWSKGAAPFEVALPWAACSVTVGDRLGDGPALVGAPAWPTFKATYEVIT